LEDSILLCSLSCVSRASARAFSTITTKEKHKRRGQQPKGVVGPHTEVQKTCGISNACQSEEKQDLRE
jgi:hypothetical protein